MRDDCNSGIEKYIYHKLKKLPMSASPFISSPTIPVHIPSGVPLALPIENEENDLNNMKEDGIV